MAGCRRKGDFEVHPRARGREQRTSEQLFRGYGASPRAWARACYATIAAIAQEMVAQLLMSLLLVGLAEILFA
jgi:hypothetical protein